MESFVTYSGRDLKLSQSINIDIFIYFHPLPVYASVKKFLLLFFILYFSISFNRPVLLLKFVKCSPRFYSRFAKQKISGNKFYKCEPLLCRAFSLFRNEEAKTWQNNRHWAQVFPCMIVVFLPPPFHRCPGAISRMVLYDTKKNYPILSPTRSILSRLLSALMFTKAESKIVNPMRKWHFRLI